MDKYEYEIKTEQIVKLIGREDYKTAKQIADTINWSREKDSRLLSQVAELYVQAGDYDEAVDLLLQAYENSKTGRRIVYRLVEVAILGKKFKQADTYCEEYHQLAPKDQDYYLLKYRVAEASKTVPLPYRIKMLEKYLDNNMQEEGMLWLAELYSEAGKVTECVKTCDEIIFWYCNGDYVIAAMELKMKYAPLTESQQKKYDSREELKAAYLAELEHQANAEKEARLAKERAAQEAAEQRRREQEAETAFLEEVAVTVASEDEADNAIFAKPVEATSEVVTEEATITMEEATEEVVESVTEEVTEEVEEMVTEKVIEAVAEEVAEEVVEAVAEEATEEVEEVVAEEATEEATEEIDNVVEEAVEMVAPVEELAVAWESDEVEEMVRRTTIQKETAAPDETDLHIFEEVKRMMSGVEDAQLTKQEDTDAQRNETTVEGKGDCAGEATVEAAAPESSEERSEEAGEEPAQVSVEDVQVSGEEDTTLEEISKDDTLEDMVDTVSENLAAVVDEMEADAEIEVITSEPTEEVPVVTEVEEVMAEPETETVSESEETDFSAVIEEEVKRQLGDIEDNRKEAKEKEAEKEDVVSEGCFAVVSDSVAHGLAYAVELLKRTPKSDTRPTKMAKTSAEKLNQSGLLVSEDKVVDKLLVITEAGNLSGELINELMMYFRRHPEAIVVFIDTDDGLRKLFEHRQELDEMFCLRYAYQERSLDEWFAYMQAYAHELDCVITEGAEILIREYLADLEENNELIYELLLKEIVDEAEAVANAFSFRNLLASAFNRKYDKDGMLLVKERHF